MYSMSVVFQMLKVFCIHILGLLKIFYPTNIQERPVVRDGEIVIRQMMLFGLAVDHFLVDGLESLTAARELKELIEGATAEAAQS